MILPPPSALPLKAFLYLVTMGCHNGWPSPNKRLVGPHPAVAMCAQVLKRSKKVCAVYTRQAPYFMSTDFRLHLAESFLDIGEPKQARIHLNAGFEHAESDREGYMLPELFRVHVLLLQAEGAPEENRQEALNRGLSLAHSQGALLLELRLAMAIARLRIEKGHRRDTWESLIQCTPVSLKVSIHRISSKQERYSER